MMYRILLASLTLLVLSACDNNRIESLYSLDEDSNTLSKCAPFDKNEFKGSLDAVFSKRYQIDLWILYLYKLPIEATESENSYIQLRGINYFNNRAPEISSSPLTFNIYNPRTEHYSSVGLELLDEDVVSEYTDENSLYDFFREYRLEIPNAAGFDSLYIGVFDQYDQPVQSVQVLVPPYEANPYTFLDKASSKGQLVGLHPLQSSLGTKAQSHDEDVFIKSINRRCLF